MFDESLKLSYNKDDISALASKRENIWSRVQNCNFMTINEKRAAVGLSPILDGNKIV
ncbi:hypothetical protein NOVO_08785 [Rickettsiales bacterium Ac37b]|nr:hypothetical protein NOVO_07545 [Rickettsiales bacterium Ac37b]AIL66076.1 hypothetical protein NOVO_08785 [Rickettsiales bacterium Ac37b]